MARTNDRPNRQRMLTVRVTEEEYEQLRALADALGLPLAQAMRIGAGRYLRAHAKRKGKPLTEDSPP